MNKILPVGLISGTIFVVLVMVGCSTESKISKDREPIDLTNYAGVQSRRPLLIAHRGGVITPETPECSLAAIGLAAAHGYDMVELDVQEAKDSQPVLFHDRSMLKACGIDRAIRELTSSELTAIRYQSSEQRIARLDEALALCRSLNMSVMLDIKVFGKPPESEEFFQRIGELLENYNLTHSTVTISRHPLARKYLADKVLFPVSNEDFQKVIRGESVTLRGQFWFGLPTELPSDAVKPLHRNGALVIPAINTFRYPPDNHYELARQDVQRLLEAGVDGFQIDSVYEDFFERR